MFDHASINRAYQLVWSDRLRAYVPAAETAKARRVGGRRSARGAAATLLAALSTTGVVHAQIAKPPAPTQLPTAGTVSAGQASITQSGARMDITQSTNRAAIDWQTFNVGSQAHVNFRQPGSQSVTLNRVLDAQPSQIFGRITSNGQVFLTNPNGVYFAPGASVDVGGLVATTHGISNSDFMAGKNTFARNGSTASVVNQGQLSAGLGGYIALLAPEVRNEGVVIAQAGTVAMASGETITLNFGDTHNLTGITVTPSQIQALVDNKHAVLAPGGLVILAAHAAANLRGGVVNNSGVIEAQGIVNRAGRIVLEASHGITQSAGGRLDVSGAAAGSIALKADRDVNLMGGVRAASSDARGGLVTIEGDYIRLAADTQIDARGASGGGTVLVGGDWQGSGTLRQATQVIMERGATIDASAAREGDGGKVVLWSDIHNRRGETVFNGRIDAVGAGTGRGGRVETSGHALGASGRVNAGRSGQWLIDPYDITIENSPGMGGVIDANAIVSALNGGAEVIVTTAGAGNQQGNMTLNADLHTGALPNDTTLTLHAHRNIVINNGYSIDATQNGNTKKLNVVLWANSAGTGGGIEMGSNTAIRSNGGNIVLGGGTNIATGYAVGSSNYEGGRGIWLREATVLNAGGGNITLRGQGQEGGEGIVLGDPGADPMNPGSSLLITQGSGTIQLNGIGTTAKPGAHTSGIKLFNNVRIQTQQGAIQLDGRGGDSLSTDVDNSGIVFGSGSRVLSASGPISLTGTVGSGLSTSGTGIRFESGTNYWGHDGGTNLAASASTITMNADAWRSDSATTVINTSGALTLKPISASFSDTLTWSGNVSGGDYTGTGTMSGFVIKDLQSLGGLTLGKSGNTSDIVISSPLRVDGAVTLIGQGILLNEEVRIDSHALTITASASTTQSERLRVASLLLNGPGDYTLDHSDNRIGTLAANVGSGSVVVKNDRPLSIGSVQGVSGVTSYNTVHIETSAGQGLTVNQPVSGPSPTLIAGGDLVLNAPVTATMSDLLVVAGGAFTNNAGANALGAAGRWLVYSASPDANTFGGLASGNIGLFGKQFSTYSPADITTDGYSGNRFLFADTQNIAVTTLSANSLYGETPTLLANHYSVAPINTYGGAILAPTLSGTPIISSAGSSSTANAGAYSVNADVSSMLVNAPGYTIVAANQGTLTIAPRPMSFSGSRVYDATTAMTANSMTLGNIVNGDTVTLSGSGVLSSKDVGSRTLAGAGTLSLSNSNYTLNGATGTFTITPAILNVSGVTAQHKVYDATAAATLAGTPTVAALGADGVSVGGTAVANFGDKNVGINKAVAVSGFVLQGADAGNYIVQQPTGLTANITAATLTVSGLTAQHRTYDATTSATLGGVPSVSALGADVVNLSGNAVATFNDKHVGNNKSVSVSGYVLQGADAGNYILQQPAALTANVTPATLTMSGVTAQDKIYDATPTAMLGGTATVNALGVDAVSLGGNVVAVFGDKNVGTAKPVTVTGYTLQGADAGNYVLQQPAGLFANITPAALAVSGVSAQNKVYDATTQATLAGTPSVAALGGDVVSVGGTAVARFGDARVADNKSVTVSGYVVQGVDAGNYVLQQPMGLTANITAPPPEVVQTRTPTLSLQLPPQPVTDAPPRELAWPAPADRVSLDVSGALDDNDTNSTTRARAKPIEGGVLVGVAEAHPGGGSDYVFRLPPAVQALLDQAGSQRVSVTQFDRTPLPQWLRFDPSGKRLLAQRVPPAALPMALLIAVGNQQSVVKIDLPAGLQTAQVLERVQ